MTGNVVDLAGFRAKAATQKKKWLHNEPHEERLANLNQERLETFQHLKQIYPHIPEEDLLRDMEEYGF